MGSTIQELIHKSSGCRNKETRENFSVVVGQEIILDKETVEEEQHQKVEYSRDDYDLNRTSGSDYDEPRARESRTFRNNHHSRRTSPERDKEAIGRRHLGQHSRDPDGHGAAKLRRSESSAKASSSKRDKYLAKSNTSGRSRSVEADHGRQFEKKSHREHRDSDYDSNDRDFRQSRKIYTASEDESDSKSDDSDDSQSDGSLDSGNSVEPSKQTKSKSYKVRDSDDDRSGKTNRGKNNSSLQARDVEEYDATTTGIKKRNKTHKKLEDSDDHDYRKLLRKGCTTKSNDKSNSAKHHPDDDHWTENTVKQSKNPRKSKSTKKNYDSDVDRPSQSSKTGRTVPKAETRDPKSSRNKPTDSKTPKKSSQADKSYEWDPYDTKPSRKERGIKEREFESQKNPKSEEKLSDSSSSDELLDTKPEKQNEPKSGSSQNAKRYEVSSTSTSSDSSSSSETHTVEAKYSESSESDSESYEGTESGSDFETVLS